MQEPDQGGSEQQQREQPPQDEELHELQAILTGGLLVVKVPSSSTCLYSTDNLGTAIKRYEVRSAHVLHSIAQLAGRVALDIWSYCYFPRNLLERGVLN